MSIAELMFLESLGAACSATNVGGSLLQVVQRAEITSSHAYTTLNRLEGSERFGRVLVDRKTAKLTRDGEEALGYARKVLAAYRLQPFHSNRFTLRIAATNRILTTMLAPHLSIFADLYRKETDNDIDFEILETTFDRALQHLEHGEVELAFGGANQDRANHPKLVRRQLLSDLQLVVVASRKSAFATVECEQIDGRKVSLDELKKTDLCLIRRDYRDSFDNEFPPEPGFTRFVVDNYSSVIAMAREGKAVGLVVDYGIPADLLKFPLAESHVSKQNYSVWQHVDGNLSKAAHLLWETVVNQAKTKRKRRAK